MVKHHEKNWKEFRKSPLSHSGGHYLMSIKDLKAAQGYARMVDISKKLDIKASTCFAGVLSLLRKGFIEEDENKFLSLTRDGEYYAELFEKNDNIFEKLFRDFLGISPEQSEKDACKIEHLITEETSTHLCMFLEFLDSKDICVKPFLEAYSDFVINPENPKCKCCPHKDVCVKKMTKAD